MNRCEACDNLIKTSELKSCKNCEKHYHYLCLGITAENFRKESKVSRVAWRCPDCRNKERKSDNTNTPVRATQPSADDSPPAQQQIGSSTLLHSGPSAHQPKATALQQQAVPEVAGSVMQASGSSIVSELKAYFDVKFVEVTNSLSHDIQLKISHESNIINEKIGCLVSGVENITGQIVELKASNEIQAVEIKVLKEENAALKSMMKDMNSRLANIEQTSRECNLEIQCVPEDKNENVLTIVKKISTVVAFDLKENELVTAHRVAKLHNDSSRPRSIIARLASPRVRDNLLASVKIFNKNNEQNKLSTTHLKISGEKRAIYVAEHLSPANKQLHAATRAAAAAKGYKFVWVRNGRIFVRKDIKSKPIYIKDTEFVHSL